MSSFTKDFLFESIQIIEKINYEKIDQLIQELIQLKIKSGNLYICGLGGSAGHASHAVNDFRKLCGINALSPTENVSELTARANDEGWDTVITGFLSNSRLSANDALLIFSVGGGSVDPQVSTPLISAANFARARNSKVFSILGRNGGIINSLSDISIIIPNLYPNRVTPHTEGLTAVIWHLIVSHPDLNSNPTKW